MIVRKLRTNAGISATREMKETSGGNGRKVPRKREVPNPVPKTQKIQNVTEIKARIRPCTVIAVKTVTEGESEKTVMNPTMDAAKKNPENVMVGTTKDDVKKSIIARLIQSEEKNEKSSRRRAEAETEKVNRTVGKRGRTRETEMRTGKSAIVGILRRTSRKRGKFRQTRDATDIAKEDSFVPPPLQFLNVTES